ncbi:DUF3987 domain-containing protein [uncultured Bacteroides sp.]|uniref:DUF3987 domain-containing protein n=1 Tax=uncultured Bacteroides sp. TaxID=162156 RepID=UPI002AA64311|nr:DUF3987 domain-containing protein [uncultured Bacteroides sp.]
MNNNNLKISFFTHVWSKKSTLVGLEEFVTEIRGNRWTVFTDTYRRWVSEGKLKDATDMKRNMPAVVPGGTCRGGHAASQMQELSGLMVLDYDHTDGRTQEIIDLLKQLPYVAVAFISISGNGVKVFIRISIKEKGQYARIYAIVSAEVNRVVNFECDKQCTDISRMCYLCHDPNIYYNPDAKTFQIDTPQIPSSHSEAPKDVTPPWNEKSPAEAPGYMVTFINNFSQKHPFVTGARHACMLKLGQASRYRGFSSKEFEELKQLAIEKYSETDFSAKEIESTLQSGYQYISSNPEALKKSFRVHKVQGSPLGAPPYEGEGEEEDDLLEKSNELRADSPYFPKEVFEHLPSILKNTTNMARSPREQDMLLMGMIANMSTALPYVRFNYDQQEYSPHLYYACVAPAAAGKGIISLTAMITHAVHRHYEKAYKEQKKKYEQEKMAWDLEVQEAFRQKRKVDPSQRPEEPKGIYINISGNTSKSRLIEHLKNNGELGAIINVSEINTLASSISQDYGQQDDILCQAAHHEEITVSFKNTGDPIYVPSPRLSMCLSGTPNQFVNLIHSQENGLYSRFALLTAEAQWKWRSAAPRDNAEEYRTYFSQLGEEILKMHLSLLESPTRVQFSAQQWDKHSEFFKQCLKSVAVEAKEYTAAVVYRHGLLAMRIASILTTLRKCEERWWIEYRTCTDEDFNCAMQMTAVLLEHSLLLSSSLPENDHKAQPLKKFHHLEDILAELPESFTYSEFISAGFTFNLSLSTCKRLLKRSVKENYTDNQGDKYIKQEWARTMEHPKVNPEPCEP